MTTPIAFFVVLSGAAALIYQVAWVRLLGLSMGTTSAAVGTVLAAFFFGLAAGSYVANRGYRHKALDLHLYLWLEVMIGASGLLLLPVLLSLDTILAESPTLAGSLTLKFMLAFLIMAIPTACMGATFPVLAALLVQQDAQVGPRLSWLYGLNTLGAVMGAALSGFVFIPRWGLDGAVYSAVSLNAMIVVCGLSIRANKRDAAPGSANGSAALSKPLPIPTWTQWRALAVLIVTGFASIATQVGWTKYLSIFAGTTVYGFAAILTVFLTGIAAGALIMQRLMPKVHAPQWWLAIGLLITGASLIFTRAALTLLPALDTAIAHLSAEVWVVHSVKYATILAFLILPTLLFGALFPLNLAVFCQSAAGVHQRAGYAYGANALASVAGATSAGFWLIPAWGTDKLLTIMAIAVLATSLLFLPASRTLTRRAGLAIGVCAALLMSNAAPHLDYHALTTARAPVVTGDSDDRPAPQLLFLREGRTGVISVVSSEGEYVALQNNGLNESQVHRNDPDAALLIETLLGVTPYALQTDARTAFVLGFGGGITTRALTLTDVQEIHVVEIEPLIIEAAAALGPTAANALADPRVKLTLDDARQILLTQPHRYDIIAAQPSHPWLARASNVFTQEFWQLVHDRLTDHGVFAQWVNLFRMDATTLRSIFKSFFTVFPHGFTFTDFSTGDLLLIGSKSPVRFDLQRWQALLERSALQATFKQHNILHAEDFLWHFGLSRADALAAAGDAPLTTDTNILSEVRLAALAEAPQGSENPYAFLKKHSRFDFLDYYVGDTPAQFLLERAQRFLDWGNVYIAERIREQLQELDAVEGRSLWLEIRWREFDFNSVLDAYPGHREWTDRAHLLYALTLLELGRKEQALTAVNAIETETARHNALFRLLYEAGEWTELQRRAAVTPEQRRWQLAGLAALSAEQPTSGDASHLIDPESTSIPLLRVLLADAAQSGDARAVEQSARRLTQAIDEETRQLTKYAHRLLDNYDAATAFLVVRRLQRVNPDADSVHSLMKRLERFSLVSGRPPQRAELHFSSP